MIRYVFALALPLLLGCPFYEVHAQNPRAFHVTENSPPPPPPSPAQVEAANARLQLLTESGDPDSAQVAIDIIRDRFEAGCAAEFVPKNPATWLGLRNDVATCIWNQDGVEGLDLTNVAAGTRSGSIYSDLVGVYFGPLRATLATMVAAAAEDDNEDSTPEGEATEDARAALQRLVNGGGNLLMSAELPLVRLNLPRINGFDLTLSGSGRAAMNAEALGAAEEDSASSLAGAFNAQMNLWSNKREVRVFGHWRSEYIRGSQNLLNDPTPASEPGLQQEGGDKALAGKSFGYSRLSIGALLWDAVLVTWTRPFFCSECGSLDIGSQVSISFQKEQD